MSPVDAPTGERGIVLRLAETETRTLRLRMWIQDRIEVTCCNRFCNRFEEKFCTFSGHDVQTDSQRNSGNFALHHVSGGRRPMAWALGLGVLGFLEPDWLKSFLRKNISALRAKVQVNLYP